MLDPNLLIEIWNVVAEDLLGLAADRVQGRSFFALDVGLPVENLRAPLKKCLEDGSHVEVLNLDASDRRGQAFRCKVTVTPLVDHEQAIAGAVLLMEPA